tara:strand:- start:17645 stop:19324 length:1680 start_codon:yes stop_codon:yes gene_type:complete
MFIGTYFILLFKYLIFYGYIYLIGKFLFSLILKFTNENKIPREVLYTKVEYIYPLLGIIFLGNLLIIYNFFLPLESSLYLLAAVFLLSIISLKNFDFDLKKYMNLNNLFMYLIIPGILVISTYDTSFNYDAGYYHLLHQNWLRESNLIIGTVNIFWPLGMSSIYEYLSAALWFDKTFVLLHLLNVYFIHFFYLFLKESLFNEKNQSFMNISFIILIFSILDNFGFGGGRNGYIYIQGVTKQDITVGILFWFLSIVILKKIVDKQLQHHEIIALSLVAFFIYEIKVSGVFIFLVYSALVFYIVKRNTIPIKKLFYLHTPVIFIATVWFSKSLLTTGCLIFPVDITCLPIFDWYVPGSTWSFEYHTKLSSKAYDFSVPFSQWVQETGAFEFRKQVFLNFLISFVILFIFRFLFYGANSQRMRFKIISFSYVLFNLLYLFFYGPIPRYLIGICLLIVSMIGFYAGKPKFHLSNILKYSFIFLSVFLLVRSTSYTSLLSNQEFRIFDPRTNQEINEEIGFIEISGNWVTPPEGDQCWANTKCIPSGEGVKFKERGLFKVAYKP